MSTEDNGTDAQGLVCSFCGKAQGQVQKLIAGPGVYICDECVDLCTDIVEEEVPDEHEELLDRLPTPQELHRLLGEYVIGQEDAKKVLSVAVYNHYKRIRSGSPIPATSPGGAGDEEREAGEGEDEEAVELAKSNILLLGPTGSGKTLLAQTLARVLQVPFAIADATALTEAGYVGEDVENILLKLITAADFDIERAEVGIVYIDEIDKVARKAENLSITRDVSGEGVQQALLKILEGAVASVPPQGGRKHPQQELIKIDTTNILFVLGGAFVDLEKLVADRVGHKGVGFGAELAEPTSEARDRLLGEVLPEDLHHYGLIPEFVGRIPVVSHVVELTEEDLVHILTEPKNALVKQYRRMFALEGVDLEFTDGALNAVARKAIGRGTGARGLRSIMEGLLLDTMYELPSRDDVQRVVVSEEAVENGSPPVRLIADGADEASEASA